MSLFWVQTFTGKKFDLLEPTGDMIYIGDIAHQLSIENRFNGATKFPESVGYHSILVCKQAPEELKLEALFHDAHEAYYKDLTSPLKQLLCRDSTYYRQYCAKFDCLVENKFGVLFNTENSKLIHEIDLRMAVTERDQLLSIKHPNWLIGGSDNLEPFPIQILERNWRNVEVEFLDLYNKYRRV